MDKQKLVLDYLTRFPDTPSLSLARKIYNENIEVFPTLEAVRTRVRYYKGATGKANKKRVSRKDHFKPKGTQFAWNKIPDGEVVIDWNTPKIVDAEKVLVISDVHVPYHDKEALVMALEYGYKIGVDALYINGDFLDCYQLSRYIRDPRLRSFAEELDAAKMVLEEIADNLDVRKWFKIGNHDVRYELYMMLKAPELLDIPDFNLANILKLEKMGYEVVESKEWAKINGLPVLHGHETGRTMYNPVNPARGAFLHSLDSVLIGHHHQPSSHTDKTLLNKIISCWSIGCLCDLHPAYMPKNRWSHGFAIIEDSDDGYIVSNKRIHEGKIYNV